VRTLLLITIIATLLASKRAEQAPVSVSTTGAAGAARSLVAELPLDVTADEMLLAYSANEVAADSRYRNHLLNVTGTVQAIKRGADSVPYLALRSAGEPDGVRAVFSPAAGSVLASVAKGDVVVMRCRGSGMTVGVPAVHACALLENYHAGTDIRAWVSEGTDDNIKAWSWE